jgi:PAS domain S-box-containing protein
VAQELDSQAADELNTLRQRVAELEAALAGTLDPLLASTRRELRDTREQLRSSEERFALVMQGTNDGLWDHDLIGGNVFYSSRLLNMLGCDAQEWSDRIDELKQRIHSGDAERVERAMAEYLAGATPKFDVEYRILHKDGRYRSVLARGFAVRLGSTPQPTRFVGTLVDITELKQAQASLEAAVDELKRSNRELEQFAYVASHDLQEPLRMVASFTQLLAERYRGRLDETADRYINYAVDGARRMQGLINDLLTLSRVGAEGLRLQQVDCEEVVKEVQQLLHLAIEQENAQVLTRGLPIILADRTQLMQLFQNLIANAIKFRGPEAPRIEVSADKREFGYEFRIRDNGIGIEPAYADRIFVIFQRLHERGHYPGSGIGLAIAKKIVEGHGGKIWVESRAGEGATFVFTIPSTSKE